MDDPGKPTVKAAVYLRQSLDATGDELAVQRQRADCLRIAAELGWEVVGEYVDNSISASDARKARPGYDRLVADHAAGVFDALICWDLDRLTRQPRQLEDWIDAAADRGLRLVTANGEADLSTDGGRMYARVKAAVARAEIERKAARQRAAAAQRAEHGRPPMGPRLTGYRSDGTLVEDEAAIVLRVFERFAGGDSLRSLAAWLAETGVPTRRGGTWNPSTVATILRNPRYAGRAVYDGKPTGKAGAWEPIVKPELFDRVQWKLDDPRRRTQEGTDRRYLGSGLYRCGVCDRPVNSHTGLRYRCPAGCLIRSAHPIDALVCDVVRARLAQPDLADLLLPAADAEMVRALNATIEAKVARIEQVEYDYDVGDIDGRRYRVATDKARAELAAARGQLARLTGGAGAAEEVLFGDDPAASFDAAPLMIRRSVIDLLMRVRLLSAPQGRRGFDPKTVTIEWRTV